MTEREAQTDDARDLLKHQVLHVKLEAGSDLVPPEQLTEPGVVSGRALDLKGGDAKPPVIRDPGVLHALRGADPYRGSIGPLPSGSTDPGHPAGDNWMYFPGPDGLRGSMRMVAFREGLLDYHLISRLREIDADAAQAIQDTIITKIIDYAKTTSAYHAARRAMLEFLDGRGHGNA